MSTGTKVAQEMHHLAPENSDVVDYVSAPYQTVPNGGPRIPSMWVTWIMHLRPSKVRARIYFEVPSVTFKVVVPVSANDVTFTVSYRSPLQRPLP